MSDQFAQHAEAVARRLWGDPNPHLSSKTELRFGAHGSRSVDLEKGCFYDHENEKGGGVLALIEAETKLRGAKAVEWLRQEVGADIEGAAEARPAQPKTSEKRRIVATYDYVDEDGEVLFQTVRFEPKGFSQRRPARDGDKAADVRDGWVWGVKGVRQVPYRLADIWNLEARGRVFVVEGEKDADNLASWGLVATCNAMGANKWPESLTPYFAGLDVVIVPDNDDAGRDHAELVANSLKDVANSIKILTLPDLPPKGDVSDWIARGGSAQQFDELAAKAREWGSNRPQSRFGAIMWADLDQVAVRQDWLVEDIMFCGDVGMTYGASGSGKSFLMVHMGLCIARGVPFLGKDTRKGAVLYQAGEGGKGLVKRLKAYRQENRCMGEDLPFVLLPERVDLFSPEGNAEAFIQECLAWQACLPEPLRAIVIDTFSTASPGANENSSEDMSRMLLAGERLNKATGAAVFYVHHKNAAGDRERGHTSLRANIDTAIEVIREKDEQGKDTKIRTARLAKLKDGEDGLTLGFELQSVQVGTYDSGKPITSCVVVPAEVEPQTSKRPRLSPGQAKFLKVLEEAIYRYGGIVPPGDMVPDQQAGVEWTHFKDLYVALCGAGRTPESIRTALSRDGDELWRADFMGRHDRWLWITGKGEVALK